MFEIIMGSDAYDMFNAQMRGDKDKIRELNIKFDKRAAEDKRLDYEWYEQRMSADEFLMYKQIDGDERLKRKTLHNDCFRGSRGFGIEWRIIDKSAVIEGMEYNPFFMYLYLREGLYNIVVSWSSDYDYGNKFIMADVPPKFIMTIVDEICR